MFNILWSPESSQGLRHEHRWGLLTKAWAICQWLCHWRKLPFPHRVCWLPLSSQEKRCDLVSPTPTCARNHSLSKFTSAKSMACLEGKASQLFSLSLGSYLCCSPSHEEFVDVLVRASIFFHSILINYVSALTITHCQQKLFWQKLRAAVSGQGRWLSTECSVIPFPKLRTCFSCSSFPFHSSAICFISSFTRLRKQYVLTSSYFSNLLYTKATIY